MSEKHGMTLVAVVVVALFSCTKKNRELSETLQWMDNTYNPHKDWSVGHGRTGWYDSAAGGEILASGSTETFTHNGCRMTLSVEDNPYSTVHSDVYGAYVYSFNLGDINPASIILHTYSHIGGRRCEDYKTDEIELFQLNCDHAEIAFSTRTEAPLIDEESHTTYAKLQGKDHILIRKTNGTRAYFEVDDVEYAARFAKAFQRAVELCGGKASPF